MMIRKFVAATLSVCTALLAQPALAQANLPQCFQMQSDALQRYYVVAQDINEPLGVLAASAQARSVRLFEYHVEASAPAGQQFTLQANYAGVAHFQPDGALEWVAAGTVTGLDGSAGSVATSRIDAMGGGWQVVRSTMAGHASAHLLSPVTCGQAAR